MKNLHTPVLAEEVISGLKIKPNGFYIDATFGAGGHSKKILERLGENGSLMCIDKDHRAIQIASQLKDNRVFIRLGSFTNIDVWVSELNYQGQVDGVLLDLGVSSMQLEDADRGFSFMRDGPLDMRMDKNQKLTAEIWLNSAREKSIVDVLMEYGQERFSRRIASAIVHERKKSKIMTTLHLVDIVKSAIPNWKRFNKNPATRTFQAIRIFINDELSEITQCLQKCLELLATEGRLVVISFHSLEDRIVKRFMRSCVHIKQIGKIIRACDDEIASNVRARSAVLRIAEKVQ